MKAPHGADLLAAVQSAAGSVQRRPAAVDGDLLVADPSRSVHQVVLRPAHPGRPCGSRRCNVDRPARRLHHGADRQRLCRVVGTDVNFRFRVASALSVSTSWADPRSFPAPGRCPIRLEKRSAGSATTSSTSSRRPAGPWTWRPGRPLHRWSRWRCAGFDRPDGHAGRLCPRWCVRPSARRAGRPARSSAIATPPGKPPVSSPGSLGEMFGAVQAVQLAGPRTGVVGLLRRAQRSATPG